MGKPQEAKKESPPKIPLTVVNSLFTSCHRVCALCWALERDGRAKEGQIAHIDRVNTNHKLANLCWLCLFHHNRYDTKMNQSKNFDKGELIRYKKDVEILVAESKLPASDNGSLTALLSVDVDSATLYGLGPGKQPGLELRVICSNQGTQATGIKAVTLPEDSSIRGSLLCRAEPRTEWSHPGAEVFYLGASQILAPGRAERWAIRFGRLDDSSGFISKVRQESRPGHWENIALEGPVAVIVEPVIGSSVLANIDKLAVTHMNLDEMNYDEFQENKADTQTLDAWTRERSKADQIDRALRWPFPTLRRGLYPSILYRS